MAEVAAAEQERETLNTGTKPIAESHKFDQSRLHDWMAGNVEATPVRWRCDSSRADSRIPPTS